jgi:hypothetical protein
MEKNIDILQELESISPAVASINRENTYSVPGNYFESFADTTLELVQPDPQLNILLTDTYSVPENFFENFADVVINKISAAETAVDEIETLSPLLAGLRNKKTYHVPKHYFDTLKVQPEVKEEARVITMNHKRGWLRTAVAASIIAVIGLSTYFSYAPDKTVGNTVAQTPNVEQNVSLLSENEIADYLGTPASAIEIAAFTNDAEPDVESILSNLNEQEIKEYLKENSGPEQKPQKDI